MGRLGKCLVDGLTDTRWGNMDGRGLHMGLLRLGCWGSAVEAADVDEAGTGRVEVAVTGEATLVTVDEHGCLQIKWREIREPPWHPLTPSCEEVGKCPPL